MNDTQKRSRAYTQEFIKQKGVEDVARETGLNRQTVRQIANGRNGASEKVTSALMATYPGEYNLKGEVSGVETDRQPSASAFSAAAAYEIRMRDELLQRQIATISRLEGRIDKLEEMNNRLMMTLMERDHPELFTDREGVKIGSDSYVTNYQPPLVRPALIGFRIGAGRG